MDLESKLALKLQESYDTWLPYTEALQLFVDRCFVKQVQTSGQMTPWAYVQRRDMSHGPFAYFLWDGYR